MNKKFKTSLAIFAMTSALLIGCNKNNGNVEDNANAKESNTKVEQNVNTKASEEKTEEVSLSDWEGEWNSIANYKDDEGLKGAYEEVAERDHITEEEAKSNFANHVAVDFGAVKIDDESITFLSEPNGAEIEKANFKYVTKHMPHFHLRVGGTAEEMLAKDDWYPTFVSPTVTIDQVYEEVAE